MSLTIYTYPNNHRVLKTLVAAAYNGVKVNVETIQMGVDNKTPEFLAMNPTGQVPVMSTPQGPIFESNAILKYVAGLRVDTNLLGANYYDRAVVDQWLDFVNTRIEGPRAAWVLPIIFSEIFPFNQEKYVQAKTDLLKALKAVDSHLLVNTYLVGNYITAADIALAAALIFPFANLFDADFVSEIPNVVRWWKTIVNQPKAKPIFGEMKLATAEAMAPGQTEIHPIKAPKAPKVEYDLEEMEAKRAAAEKAKPKNELDELPKSPMSLEDVKRGFFLKQPLNHEYFETFWANFDHEGYCIAKSVYKYPEDIQSEGPAVNLLGGFITRCEPIRKYTFGCVIGAGSGADNQFYGVWVFRGKGIPSILNDVTDAEEHDFQLLDANADSTKEYLKTIFTCQNYEGKPVFIRKFLK